MNMKPPIRLLLLLAIAWLSYFQPEPLQASDDDCEITRPVSLEWSVPTADLAKTIRTVAGVQRAATPTENA